MKKNNKLKENPMMVKDKKVKIKNTMVASEDDNEIKRFIIIILVIALLSLVVYFVTNIFSKSKNLEKSPVVSGEVDYDKVNVGTILNRPYDEYYVLVYNSEDDAAVKYSSLIKKYKENTDALKIYFCDLDNTLNSKYYNVSEDNKSNKNINSVEDFDFGDLTLLKISNGKVKEYIEDYTTIQEKLK